MSEDMPVWFTSVETIDAATERVAWLYSHIEKHHGPEATRKIFLGFLRKSKARINEQRNQTLLWMYDQMPEPKNIAALAREVVEKNAERLREDQLTPRPQPSLDTVDRHIRNLVKARDRAQRGGK